MFSTISIRFGLKVEGKPRLAKYKQACKVGKWQLHCVWVFPSDVTRIMNKDEYMVLMFNNIKEMDTGKLLWKISS